MGLTVTKGTADQVSGVVSGSTLVASSVTSFSPAAGEMVRAQVAWLNATDHLGDTFTCVDSHGNNYGTPTYNGDPGDGDGGCYLFVWDHVYPAAPGATTLKITRTNGSAQADCLILPWRCAGYDPDQSTAAKNKFSEAGTPTSTYEIALTTTRPGSMVFVLAAPNHNGGATGPVTPIAGTTQDVDWDDGTVGSRGTFGHSTSNTGTPGSTTFGWTSANPSPFGYGVMALELLPAPTVTPSVVQAKALPDAASGAFDVPVTAGNTVVVAVLNEEGSNVTVSVTGVTLGGSADHFAQAVAKQSGYAAGVTQFASIWVDPDCAGGQTAVAVTGSNLDGLTAGNGIVIMEIAGTVSSVSLAAVLDQTASASGTTGTAVSSGVTPATTQAGEIFIGAVSGADALSGFTGGWTALPVDDGGGTFNALGYKAVSAPGTASFGAAQASSGPWAGAVITLKGAAAASGGGTPLPAAAQAKASASVPVPVPAVPAAQVTAAARVLLLPVPLPVAHATAAAGPLAPAAVMPAAPSATALAFPPSAFLQLPVAQVTASASAPVPVPVTGTAQAEAEAFAPGPPVMLPAAAGAVTAGFPLALVIPSAPALMPAFPLAVPARLPSAPAAAARAFAVLPPVTPLPPAPEMAAGAFPLRLPALLPPAGATARARPLQPPQGSRLSAGYPGDVLDARVELLLGTAWTDVTAAALPDGIQYGSIKSGQPDGAQQPNPGTMAAAWDNPTGTFSPRNAHGPYFGQLRQNTPARVSVASPFGTRLRLEANASDRAYVDDSTALHITGSMEVRIECRLSDWQGCVLAARWDNTLPSWYLRLNGDGTLSFSWFDSSGAQHTATSSLPVPYTSGTFAVAARFDVSALTLDLYTSDSIDGTFAQLGAGFAFGSGIASIRAGNAPLVVGWSGNLSPAQLLGEVTRFRLYNGVGGTLAAGADFTSVAPGAVTWTDSAGSLWKLAGGAEVSARDYRLYAETGSIAPTATPARSAKAPAVLSGRLRRLQQGSQPAADSPMRRAVMSQAGSLFPVAYWPMEDGGKAAEYGPAIGSSFLVNATGTSIAASDTSFEASAALPQLSGASLSATVPPYSGATAWTVRFLCKVGQSLPASGDWANVCQILLSSGTVRQVDLNVDSLGNLQLKGINASAGTVFDSGWVGFASKGAARWYSIEARPVTGGNVSYNIVSLDPGATTIGQLGSPPQVTESLGTVTTIEFNTLATTLTDTVIGHVSFQKAWTAMGTLGAPLNAWRGELAAARFTRICAENGIACRVLGSPSKTQALGPQPRGSVWQVLRDAVWADQGILFEPHWAALGLGFRTRASMTGQSPAVTLSFASANLPGALIAADDDQGLLNDITASMPDGTQVRVVLDDGSPRSVSEPPVGAGRYAGQPPQPFNTADAAGLASVAAFYLTRTAVDEARYRQVTADLGIPGAPAADIARLRPGDLIVIEVPPATDGSEKEPAQLYQSTDIRQLATGATEVIGPGRAITWDCTPASPWD